MTLARTWKRRLRTRNPRMAAWICTVQAEHVLPELAPQPVSAMDALDLHRCTDLPLLEGHDSLPALHPADERLQPLRGLETPPRPLEVRPCIPLADPVRAGAREPTADVPLQPLHRDVA